MQIKKQKLKKSTLVRIKNFQLPENSSFFACDEILLSQLELNVLLLYINCRTINALSNELKISFKSAERTLARVKDKIGLFSKSDMREWAEAVSLVERPAISLMD